MKTGELLNQSYKHMLGYSCLGVRIKPVHIANGLFRSVEGGVPAGTRLLNRTVCRYNLQTQSEINPTAALVSDQPDVWGDLARAHHREDLNRLRTLLRGLVGADGAVFPTADKSSYTLSHADHLTSDPSDGGVGAFLAALSGALDDDGGECARVLRELLHSDHDEVSTVLAPLTGGVGERRGRRTVSRSPPARTGGAGSMHEPVGSAVLSWSAEGFRRVVSWESQHAAKAGALQRIVTFGSLVVLLHMAHRASELGLGPRPPLLLCYLSGHTALQSASNQTYRLALRAVDRLLPSGLAGVLGAHFDLGSSNDQRELVKERLVLKNKRGRLAAAEDLERSIDDGASPETFIAKLSDLVLEDNDGGTAADYWRTLGVRVGLLVPRGNRGFAKRLEPSPQVLTVLMTSLLDPGERVAYPDFLDLLSQRTGFFVGGLHSDVELLRQGSIFEATEADLADNSEAFKRHLIDAGFAREYADGVTIVSLQGVK